MNGQSIYSSSYSVSAKIMFLFQMCTEYDPTLDPSLFSETVQNKMVVGSFNLMMYFQPNVKYMIKISSDHLLDCYLVVYIEKYCKIGPNKAAFIGSGLNPHEFDVSSPVSSC